MPIFQAMQVAVGSRREIGFVASSRAVARHVQEPMGNAAFCGAHREKRPTLRDSPLVKGTLLSMLRISGIRTPTLP